MPSLDQIRRRLASHRPEIADLSEEGLFEAAVAILLHEAPEGLGMLFIERARVEGDPWSGQMAFPGGRRDAEDPDLQKTAAREALEEVGIAVPAPIGRLDDFVGSRDAQPRRLRLAPYVYALEERPSVVPNREVRSAVWVPTAALADPELAIHYDFERQDYRGTFPAIRFRQYTIWGLTYRVVRSFFELLDEPLPQPPRVR